MRTDTDFITYDFTPITKIDERIIVKIVVDPENVVVDEQEDEHGDNVSW